MAAPAKALVTVLTAALMTQTPLLGATGAATPASGQTTQASAAQRARLSGVAVELEEERTETDRVFVNPSGTKTLETYAEPVRAKVAGQWVPIDTTLRRRADGSVAPVATTTPLSFSGGPSGGPAHPALVTLSDKASELSLSWPGPLPEPLLAGDTATYPEVLPGVDLKMRALAAGFAQVLVVKDKAAAADPRLARLRFAVATKGLTMHTGADGTTVARGPDGKAVFGSGAPTMWDSNAAGITRHSRIPLQRADGELAVLPDLAMLRDPGTEFPVYIDPSYASTQYRWTMVNSARKDTSYWTDDFYREDARVGKVWGSSDGPWRTFFQVAIARVARATISRAWFSISMHHSGSCSATTVELWHTREIDPATAVTWNNSTTAWLDGSALDTRSGKANNSSCGQPPVLLEFGLTNNRVKDLVQASVSGSAPKEALSFGLKIPSANETNQDYWKRFTQSTARLNIEFNGAPHIPTGVTTVPPTLCGTASVPTPLNTATPTFTGVGWDPDGDNVSSTMEILSGETVIASAPTGTVGSGSAVSWPPVSAGVLPDNQPTTVFSYRAHTNDAALAGTNSTRCYFTVDTARPGGVTVASSDFPNGAIGKAVGETGLVTFTKTAADNDIAGFSFGFSTGGVSSWVPVKPDGSATVPLTLWPEAPGDPFDVFKTLYVRAVDRAGNLGPLNSGWALWARGRMVTTPSVRSDVNGDRRADVTAVVNQGFGRTTVWNFVTGPGDVSYGYLGWDSGINGGFPVERIQSVTGDFDGDGRTDVAVMREDPGPIVRLFLLRSDGTRFVAASEPVWSGSQFRVSHLKLVAGDFDGDGDDDLGELQGLIDRQTRLWVHTSNNGLFGEPVQVWDSGAGVRALAQTNPLAGDFDGDGDDDIADVYDVGANQARLLLHQASGGTFTAPVQAWDSGAGTFATAKAQFAVANIDANGDDEIVALFDDGAATSRLVVLTGTGVTGWSAAPWWTSAAGGFNSATATLFTGDLNADGRTDAAVLSGDNVYGFASTGTAFTAPVTRWQGTIGAATPTAYVAPGRKYRIQPVHTNKCWDVPANSTTNGTVIDQYDCVATATWEQFTLERIGASPNFYLKTSGGKCLDVKSWSLLDAAQLVQFSCGVPAQPNQQFRVEHVAGSGLDMIVTIRNIHSDKCLQVAGGSTANNAQIVQAACGTTIPTYRQFFLRLDP